MKRTLLGLVALILVAGAFAPAEAQYHHRRHRHCYWRHHHRVCRWY